VTREDRLGNSSSLTFPEWVPPAITEAANQLNDELAKENDPTKALQVLSRLVSDPLMKRVWHEVYRKKRVGYQSSEEYFNPACTNASRTAALRRQASELRDRGGEENELDAKLLEAEAAIIEDESDPLVHPHRSTQERAAQLLFWHAYRGALDNEPVYHSDLVITTTSLRELVKELLKGVETLRASHLDLSAEGLKKVVEEIEDEAENIDPFFDAQTGQRLQRPRFPQVEDPWVIVRETPDVQIRSFVTRLSILTIQLFGNPLHHTLANITNAVFNTKDVTDGRVRELLRIRPEQRAG
jgi:hypothetical protein